MLLERKIIFVKKKFGDIAVIMESLVSLLNPLKWNFVFITYLTPKLLDCLEAPFPYIIGVSKRVWEDQCIIRELPNDIIIFDLDSQDMTNYFREELPPLPEPHASVLTRTLKDLLDMKDRFVDGLYDEHNSKLSKEKIDEYYWGYAQLRIKQGFLNFFLLTINNYIGYFKNMDEEGDLSPMKKDKKNYDKMTSSDIFDFDAYLNQFEGKNKEFMDKFTKTQGFSNFIEETYTNISHKTPIGFFKTNMDVLINYSFKKLKKEQNKLIDKIFYNFQNPIKFNVGRMFKLYKNQYFQKHQERIRQFQEHEEQEGHLPSSIETRPDLFEKLLLAEIKSSAHQQLSLINSIDTNLITEMPGIEYEQINTYKQLKSQRSEQSLERKGVESQQRKMFGKTQLDSINQQEEEISNIKSRNNKKMQLSRSGDNRTQMEQSKNYKNFLLMADNKRSGVNVSQSEEDSYFMPHQFANLTQDAALLSIEEYKQKNEGDQYKGKMERINSYKQQRVQSENSFAKGAVQVRSGANMESQFQKLSGIQENSSKMSHIKSKTYHLDQNSDQLSSSQMNKTYDIQRRNNLTTLVKSSQAVGFEHSSPSQPQYFVSSSQNNFYRGKMNQNSLMNTDSIQTQRSQFKGVMTSQTNPLHVIKGAIALHRSKHGLQLKSDDRMQTNQSTNQILLSPSATLSLKAPQNLSNFQSNPLDGAILSGKSGNSSQNQFHQSRGGVIGKSEIDLMNPGKKKFSRNEERKQAYKVGMLRFESHQSFYSFYSPKEEEFNKYLLQQKGDQYFIGSNEGLMMSHNKLSLINQFSGGEDDYNTSNNNQLKSSHPDKQKLSKGKTIVNNNSNHINYKKRTQNIGQSKNSIKDTHPQQSMDPLATNINFKNNYIKQKPQNNQSPSIITNTENSAKKSPLPAHLEDYLEGVPDLTIVDSSPNLIINKQIKDQINKTLHSSPKHQATKKFPLSRAQPSHQPNSTNISINLDLMMEQKKSNFYISPHYNDFKKDLKGYGDKKQPEKTIEQLKQRVQTNQKLNDVYELDMEEVCNEDRPLKQEDFGDGGQPKQQITMGERQMQLRREESPSNQIQLQSTIAFKTFMPQQKKDLTSQQSKSKKPTQLNTANRSPTSTNQAQKPQLAQGISNFSQKVSATTNNVKKPRSPIQSTNPHPKKTSLKTTTDTSRSGQSQQIQRKKSAEGTTEKISTSSAIKQQIGPKQLNDSQLKQKQLTYKQRPLQNPTYSKHGVYNIQLDFENKDRLTSMLHSEALQQQHSLRISPLPDLSIALEMSKERIQDEADLPLNQNSQMANVSPKHEEFVNKKALSRKASMAKVPKNPSFSNRSLFNYNSTSTLHRNSEKSILPDKKGSQLSGFAQEDMFYKNKGFDKQGQFPGSAKNSVILKKGFNSNQQSFRSSHLTNQVDMRTSDMVVIQHRGEVFSDSQRNSDLVNNFQSTVYQGKPVLGRYDQPFSDSNTICNYNSAALQNDLIPNSLTADLPSQALQSYQIKNTSPQLISSQSHQLKTQTKPPIGSIQTQQKDVEMRNFMIQGGTQSVKNSQDFNLLSGQMSHGSKFQNQSKSPSPLPHPIQIQYTKQIVIGLFEEEDQSSFKKSMNTGSVDNVLGKQRSVERKDDSQARNHFEGKREGIDKYRSHYSKTKQAQSPQMSSSIVSSNNYMKSLQNHEYQKHESDKKSKLSNHPRTSNLKKTTPKQEQAKPNAKHTHQLSQNQQIQNSLKTSKYQSKVNEEMNYNKSEQKVSPTNAYKLKYQSAFQNHQVNHNRDQEKQRVSGGVPEFHVYDEQNKAEQIYSHPSHFQNNMKSPKQFQMSHSNSRKSSSNSYHSTPSEFQQSKLFKTIAPQSEQTYPKDDLMPQTIRNNGMPIKKFGFQQIDSEIVDNNCELIDLPRQIETEKFVQLHRHEPSVNQRASKLLEEIDQMMEKLPKHSHSKVEKEKRHSKGFKGMESKRNEAEQVERKAGEMGHQVIGLPLNEIKYGSNEQNLEFNSNITSSNKSSLLNQMGTGVRNSRSRAIDHPINESKLATNTFQMHSMEHKSASYQESISQAHHQQRSLRPHGQTTCFIFPTKDSIDYIKRDLNQDVFCKISSHQGDLDKDPHTPKSQQSPRSIEKIKRHKHEQNMKIQFQKTDSIQSQQQHKSYFSGENNVEGSLKYPQRLHEEQKPMPIKVLKSKDEEVNTPSRNSSSLDGRHLPEPMGRIHAKKSSFMGFEVAPIQGRRRVDLCDNSGEQILERQGQSDELIYHGEDEVEDFGSEGVSVMKKQIRNSEQIRADYREKMGMMEGRRGGNEVQYEVMFEESDLRDTDDKLTSRDANFSRLRAQKVAEFE